MKAYVLGDSISLAYGPYLEQYLQGVMEYARKEGDEEAHLNLDDPQGANGGDSSMVLSFLQAKAAAEGIDADVLLLNCGLHDLRTDPSTGKKQIPLERYQDNLRSIITIVGTMRPKLIWIRTTPCDEKVHNRHPVGFHRFAADCEAYNRAADCVMAEAGVPIIDLFSFTNNLGTDLFAITSIFANTSASAKRRSSRAGLPRGDCGEMTKNGKMSGETDRENTKGREHEGTAAWRTLPCSRFTTWKPAKLVSNSHVSQPNRDHSQSWHPSFFVVSSFRIFVTKERNAKSWQNCFP